MGFSKSLVQQYDSTMADGKKSFKNLIKPLVALFRKNKKDKTKNQENENKIHEDPKSGEINENNKVKNIKNQENDNETTNLQAPYISLLKKLEKLDIDKNRRLKGSADFEDDSICDPNETLEELEEKFNRVDDIDAKSETNLNKIDEIPKLEDQLFDSDSNEELCENFSELVIEKVEEVEDDDEELKKFSMKVIKDDKACRNDSQSSEDSGFAEKCLQSSASDDENEVKEEVKQKKLQVAYLKRAPIKNRTIIKDASASAQPYHCEINLINPQIHSGGQVFVNNQQAIQNQNFTPSLPQQNLPEQPIDLENIISKIFSQEEINMCLNIVQNDFIPQFTPGSNYADLVPDLDSTPQVDVLNENISKDILTPPSSVNSHSMYSPRNVSMGSPASLRIMESPQSSLNDENERYREIPQIENSSPVDYLNSHKYTEVSSDSIDSLNSSKYTETSSPIPQHPLNNENSSSIDPLKSPVESSKPASKNTMKFYKDRQTELQNKFAKMECCQANQTSCKEIFKEKLLGLPAEDRRKLCCSVANLELESTLSVLQRTLRALARNEAEGLNMALLCLICEKVLSERKALFVDEDFGLELLKIAVFLCYKRPVITRYLVQCIRVVTRSPDYQQLNKTVFTEVDSQGDNLVIACARAGDEYANALRELVRAEQHDVPLFHVDHVNTDGYTALHVCCAEHSASTPRLHTLHVLVKHARADRYIKDRKGGETGLHLAVNSANCDLDLVLLYFNERSERAAWFGLAHHNNNGGKKPLDYAKYAEKWRKNYPAEIKDFLEKCRKVTRPTTD